MGYVTPQIDPADDDPDAIAEEQYAMMQDRFQGWEAQDASPETVLIQASAQEHAETRRAAKETFDTVAVWMGRSIDRVEPLAPRKATGFTTWTFNDPGPQTIPAGTQLTLRGADGSRLGFETVEEFTTSAGATATAAGAVQIVAVQEGAEYNDLSADAQLEEVFDTVLAVTVVAPTTSGSNGQTTAEYLARLVKKRRRGSDALITPDDFSDYAGEFFGDVGRGLTLKGYDAVLGTTDNAGVFTVVPIRPDGLARSTQEMAALKAAIEPHLITGAVVHVIAPTYTPITVSYTAEKYGPFQADDVRDRGDAAVADFLNPAVFGLAPYASSFEPEWLADETVVAYNDLVAVLENVRGLRRVTSLTINGGDSDVTLGGPVGLPTLASVAGVITN